MTPIDLFTVITGIGLVAAGAHLLVYSLLLRQRGRPWAVPPGPTWPRTGPKGTLVWEPLADRR